MIDLAAERLTHCLHQSLDQYMANNSNRYAAHHSSFSSRGWSVGISKIPITRRTRLCRSGLQRQPANKDSFENVS
jgi:hypothetical protein